MERAQPNYNSSKQERLQKAMYGQLSDDNKLCLTDGLMNYIACKLSTWLLSKYEVRKK